VSDLFDGILIFCLMPEGCDPVRIFRNKDLLLELAIWWRKTTCLAVLHDAEVSRTDEHTDGRTEYLQGGPN